MLRLPSAAQGMGDQRVVVQHRVQWPRPIPGDLDQAYAGLLWSKQFYHYVVRDWLDALVTQTS